MLYLSVLKQRMRKIDSANPSFGCCVYQECLESWMLCVQRMFAKLNMNDNNRKIGLGKRRLKCRNLVASDTWQVISGKS